MFLSCCIWTLSGAVEEMLPQFAELGFSWIDVRPDLVDTGKPAEVISGLGLKVSCMAASFGMPEGTALDSVDSAAAECAAAHVERALELGRILGANTAYLVPGEDGSRKALTRYARGLERVAERAAEKGIRLGIEHFPGRCLPTVEATLDFLREIGHPNLYLLFDIGHAQISGEDPAAAIERAGDRLGYVHLDDNDGRNDQHLGLTDGMLTEETLRRACAALKEIGYNGAVSLELNAQLSEPLAALERSKRLAKRVLEVAA